MVLDAPGHRGFVPNTIAGTSSADCGILVVAAMRGKFEAGFAKGGGNDVAKGMSCGQTREHVILLRGLGVQQFVVAVNKLDAADPPWCRERYMHIMSRVLDFRAVVPHTTARQASWAFFAGKKPWIFDPANAK